MTDDFSAAAPRPWHAYHNGTCWQIDAGQHAVVTTQFCYAEHTETNVRLIVAAVNAYRPQPEPAADDVERVARALARHRVLINARRDRRELDEDMIARAVEFAWKDFVDEARAAIAAMPQVEALRAERDALRQALGEAEQALETIGREPNVGNWVFAQTRAALARIREITGGKP